MIMDTNIEQMATEKDKNTIEPDTVPIIPIIPRVPLVTTTDGCESCFICHWFVCLCETAISFQF